MAPSLARTMPRARLREGRTARRRLSHRAGESRRAARVAPAFVRTHRGDVRSVQTEEDGTWPRNTFSIIFFFIAPRKACPTSSAMLKSRNVAISASSPIVRDVNGTSVDTSLPRRRMIILIFAGVARNPTVTPPDTKLLSVRTSLTPATPPTLGPRETLHPNMM